MSRRIQSRFLNPTKAELDILVVLWKTGPSTVRQVHKTIGPRRGIEYSTVLKFMQIMTEKGLTRRRKEHRAHIYVPTLQREITQQQLIDDLVARAFDGSRTALLISTLRALKPNSTELAEIRNLLHEYQP